ncbi:putative response regulator protein [Secundilactobacillus oryzae JCM 18671]|uniref:Putative response regulator protein n=1 Tax=Secundilactobacillus oryzae JCM 18671 TaxID=1291743 RepID=A0A081BGH3_9LACO|nr:response regulator transcription factor [Secundilactobacillus oryzae]GAK47141.1 putative response regulator protein [Secundilactobacillus oryzae JCM 18671]
MTSIMIVEDDAKIVSEIQHFLERWQYEGFAPTDFQEVLANCTENQPDLVLIDISLPYFNGFYWCQEIRKVSQVPIIFISSADENMNQIMAMNMGADDFVAKTFDLSVLVAKIQALLRRSYDFGQTVVKYQLGTYEFLPTENVIKRMDEEESLTLSPNESRILLALMQRHGTVVPKETIIEALWQSDSFIDNNTLAVNLTRLRAKLAGFGITDLIQTVKGKGYLIEEAVK